MKKTLEFLSRHLYGIIISIILLVILVGYVFSFEYYKAYESFNNESILSFTKGEVIFVGLLLVLYSQSLRKD